MKKYPPAIDCNYQNGVRYGQTVPYPITHTEIQFQRFYRRRAAELAAARYRPSMRLYLGPRGGNFENVWDGRTLADPTGRTEVCDVAVIRELWILENWPPLRGFILDRELYQQLCDRSAPAVECVFARKRPASAKQGGQAA